MNRRSYPDRRRRACPAAALLASAAPALANDADVIRRGGCSGSSDWKLKASPENGRIEVEGEVDSNVTGQTWKWRMLHNGEVSARGTATTTGPSGSFDVRRLMVEPRRHRPASAGAPRTRPPARSAAVASASSHPGHTRRQPACRAPHDHELHDRSGNDRSCSSSWSGVVVALVLAWVTGVLGERLAREQAVDDARTTTELLAETVIEPALSSGLLDTEARRPRQVRPARAQPGAWAARSCASRSGTPTAASSTPTSRG